MSATLQSTITTSLLNKKRELNEVFLLRGIASLVVCIFHLVLGNTNLFPSDNLLEKTASFGYLGVEVFFILSGYVICYSLPQNFSFRDLKTFFLKRITRIEPPYIISIVFVLVLNFASQKFTGYSASEVNVWVVLGHLAYINNFTNPATYVNVVYWTLGIEFQFYFLIAFIFPFIKNARYLRYTVLAFFLGLACIATRGSMSIILPFLAYFCIGIVMFFYKIEKRITLPVFTTFTVLSLVQLYLFQGIAGAIAAFFTILVILLWNYVNSTIRFFSMISYSLYLTHVPIGGKVINLGMRYVGSNLSKYVLVLVALITSIGFAWLFYKWIELPAFKISKRFRYRTAVALNEESSLTRNDIGNTKKNSVAAYKA